MDKNQVYDVPPAGEHFGMLGFKHSLWCIVAMDAWDVVGTYLVTGRLEAEMVTSALLGIDDGLDYGTAALGRWHGNIDHGGISIGALLGIDEVLVELEWGEVMFCISK